MTLNKKTSVTQKIENRLKESVRYRNDDSLLRLAIWEDLGFYLTDEQKELYPTLPADGGIVRRRREMRAEYPESKEVMEKRFNAFRKERDRRSSFPKRLLGWIR